MTIRRVVISQRVVENDTYTERRDALSHEWILFFNSLFPELVIVPVPNCLSDVRKWADAFDFEALVLSNGNDWGVIPERDKTETELVEYFRGRGRPIIGICRGLQSLNAIMYGAIEPDVAIVNSLNHIATIHEVMITAEPFLEMAGSETLMVNSFHKQGVLKNELGAGLHAFAFADGGVVEGMFHESEPILAIQWHPERANQAFEFDRRLITTFFNSGAFWL